MSPRRFTDESVRQVPLLAPDMSVGEAVRHVIDSGMPALPVVSGEKLCGIFGEREFMTALFPGYLNELKSASFLDSSIDEALQKRGSCRHDEVRKYMNTEHVDVGTDYSDAQVAEIFLHHRVLIVPVADHGRVVGIITRSDFFRTIGKEFLASGSDGDDQRV